MTPKSREGPAAGPAPAVPPAPPDAVQWVPGVGPARAKLLANLGVTTAADLLHLYPRRHEDRREVRTIASLRDGEQATVRARVASVRATRMGGRRSLVRVSVTDGTGVLHADWWNQPYRAKGFREGQVLVLSGRVAERRGLSMPSPETESLPDDGAAGESLDWGRVVPVYPLTKGLRQPALRRAVKAALDRRLDEARDPLPPDVLARESLPPLRDALAAIHFPADMAAASEARRRLRFDEAFLLQLALALRRRDLVREERGFAYAIPPRLDARIRARFPFRFTAAQDGAVADIRRDLESPHPMNRLLQGDVGCGKTAVALYAVLAAVAHRRQAAVLAPTEILAEQHEAVFRRALEGSRVRVERVSGGAAAKRRTAMRADVAEGGVDLVVGTHALLEEGVRFRDLGLAVVDEQHRFGVLQRRTLRDKGLRPDLLYMTATPIPRTLCMTVFGDLDVSVVAERPPGRRPVTTRWVRPDEEDAAHALVVRACAAGRQAFVVCPLVEESEELDLRAAEKMAKELARGPYRGLRVGLLHGRMARDAKSAAMEEFRAGRTQVLVSTVVVEVGVDVPNASVLAVLHAERFGLGQLHQLRGRVGRGAHPSTCLLFADPRTPEARARIDAMVATEDGFRIAEEDLRIRGPGEFFGTRQSGLPDLRMPEALADASLLQRARTAAFDLVARDPELSFPAHAALRDALYSTWGDRLGLARV